MSDTPERLPPPPRKPRVALFGTMNPDPAKDWRRAVGPRLAALGYEVLDNTDDGAWEEAERIGKAEVFAPLIRHDLELMRSADLVLWRNQGDLLGKTARIELGRVLERSALAVVQADPEAPGREKLRANVLLAKRAHWVDTLDGALELIRRLLPVG